MTEVVEEIIPVTEPEPELPEQIYEYQPTDEAGRPLGGKQVLKYKTNEELIEKLHEQNNLLIRKLRAETRKNRLGINEAEEIAPEAPRFSSPVEYAPRELSNDERVQLSRDLLDPEKSIEAQAKLFEASVGVSPEVLRNTLKRVEESTSQIQARQEADAFVAANPDYIMCQENSDAILQWMMRYELALVRQNFQKAYDTLKAQDPPLLLLRNIPRPSAQEPAIPARQEPPAVQPSTVEPPAPGPAPVVPRVPTGLNRSNSASSGTPPALGSDIIYEVVVDGQKRTYTGMNAIKAMPGDEYKRRIMSDPSFLKRVEKMEAEYAALKRSTRYE